MYGYTLFVYKKDRRCKSGEKLVNTYRYEGYSGHAMMDEIKHLYYSGLYSRNKFRLDFEALAENTQFN